ncbi:Vasohibin-domain-containing protein, partial [Baffinella frigidus]
MSALPRKALLDAMPHLAGLSFPLDEAKLLEIVNAIKEAPSLPNAPRQEPPRLHPSMPPVERHRRIQQYIEAFEYNFTGENFFNVKGVRQNQSLFRVLELAKRVMREALPIKCVEAVYLGIYLTQSMQDMERLPLIFNSEIGGHRYGHIVLLVRYNGKLGALGLSRRPDLMYKAWGFETLSDIIAEYKRSYEHWSHSLLKIKIGTIIPHEGSGKLLDVVDWAHTVISLKGQTWEETDLVLHRKARSLG